MLITALRNAALISLACLMTYLAGKDANWDLINYHFYIAHAWSHSKYLADFMGAGPNSYFNPIGYLPFYCMVMAGWHSLIIGLLLGAFLGLSLSVLWELSARFLFKGAHHVQWLIALSILLAVSSPVYAGTVGGTFLEPTLTVFVLSSLLMTGLGCENGVQQKSTMLIFLGGLLMGLATGFKITNIIFVAAMGLSLLLILGIRWKTLLLAASFSTGVVVGYLTINGWWAYYLYQEFGNPFFPFFNELFQSPDFSTSKLDHDRFKPTSLLEVIILPFKMAEFHSWIYVENNAPDIRPTLLVLFGIAAAAKKLVAKVRANNIPELCSNVTSNTARNIIFTFFVCSIALWLWTTGNGRYALPVLILIGPLLTFAIYKATSSAKRTLIVASIVLVIQLLNAWAAGNPRWTNTDWTHLWFKATVPQRLKDNPFAYLSLGSSRSNSVVAPFLHPGSTFVSLTGGTYAFRPDGPGNKRIHQIIKLHNAHLRMLVTATPSSQLPETGTFNNWDMSLAPWELKIVRTDCEFLAVDVALTPDKNFHGNTGEDGVDKSSNVPIISCALEPSIGENEATLRERKRLTLVFDRVEESCPLLFSPRGWQLTRYIASWERHYLQSDIVVRATNGRLFLSKYQYGPFDVDMGSIEDWENGTSKFVCKRLPKPW